MRLITERTQIRSIASRWRSQYPRNRHDDKDAISEKLATLDTDTATADDVATIIGNDSWCGPTECDECGAAVEVAVQMGEKQDYESNTVKLCFACVKKAMLLMGPLQRLRTNAVLSTN